MKKDLELSACTVTSNFDLLLNVQLHAWPPSKLERERERPLRRQYMLGAKPAGRIEASMHACTQLAQEQATN